MSLIAFIVGAFTWTTRLTGCTGLAQNLGQLQASNSILQ
jgi:hypothetical protein